VCVVGVGGITGKHLLIINGKRNTYTGNISSLNRHDLGELETVVKQWDELMLQVGVGGRAGGGGLGRALTHCWYITPGRRCPWTNPRPALRPSHGIV